MSLLPNLQDYHIQIAYWRKQAAKRLHLGTPAQRFGWRRHCLRQCRFYQQAYEDHVNNGKS